MELSGQQWKQLRDALIDAFPNKSSIEQMLWFELEKNLDAMLQKEPPEGRTQEVTI